MFSRKSALLLSEIYNREFRNYRYSGNNRTKSYFNDLSKLYDFLYTHDYSVWFCNKVKLLNTYGDRQIKEFIMKLHTGETQYSATTNWN